MTGTVKQFDPHPPVPPELGALVRIRAHARALGGAPGAEVSGLEPAGTGQRVRFQDGAIYESPRIEACWVHGAIGARYDAFGGAGGWLGLPLTDESATPDGQGRYNHFEHGSIYWTATTGAFEVHGAIRDEWASMGWETSFLGYPITDETGAPGGLGRFNQFEGGSIQWTSRSGAFALHERELPASLTAHADIVFDDSTPVGGTADLLLNRDGSFTYSGHLHNSSGFVGYTTSVVCVLVATSTATAYAFPHTGTVSGVDLPGSSDDDWGENGTRTETVEAWTDLWAGHEVSFHTEVDFDIAGLVDLVKKYYPYVLAVVEML
jgi:hypothetical protein